MNHWDRVGLLFCGAMLALSIFGLSRIQTNTEDVLQWLPDKSAAREDFNFFRDHFGSDDFVMLTWQGCATDDPRLQQMGPRLRNLDSEGLIGRVTSGYDITRELGEALELSRASIVRRLQGVFFGLQVPEQTCVLVELSQAGTRRRAATMELIWQAVDQTPGLERGDVAIAGYPYIATYIDQQLHGSYVKLLVPSVVLATVIALVCLGDPRLGMIVFFTAVGAATVSVAIAPACGFKLGGLMSIIPALVFVLATSGSVHLMRYSLQAIGEPGKLLAIGWRPCTISTATTAVGMLSLTRSEFPAIRNFGLFCAAGVGFALAFQLAVVPWLLLRFGQPGLHRLAARSSRSTFWSGLTARLDRHRLGIVLLFSGLLAAGIGGLSQLRAEVEIEKLFRSDSPLIASLRDVEEQLAPMDQTEVLLVFNSIADDRFYHRADYTRRLQAALRELPGVEVAYSLVNFLPSEPRADSARSFLRRAAYRDVLDKQRQRLANGEFLAIDRQADQEIWRICVRFPFTRDVDFEAIRHAIEEASRTIAWDPEPATTEDAPGPADDPPPRLVYTGQTYLFHHAQGTLLADLFQNFLLAFAIITPLLILVLRSLSLGLIAMLPNIFPTVVVFGGLGWWGFPVDLALAMTASVALGIAVDDTTHFLVRFRDHGGSLRHLREPMALTMSQCGPAMWHTTLIASASLLTYTLSDMSVVARFSWAISGLLAVALIADVAMLPAVLLLLGKRDGKPQPPPGAHESA